MDSIYQTYSAPGGSDGLFLRLKDGDAVKLRVASDPAVYTQTFDEKTTTRYAWTIWNRKEAKPQVFSGGVSILKQFQELYEEWNDPMGYDVTIKRTGEGMETRYTVVPAPKSEDLTDEQIDECEKIDLLKVVKGWWLKDFEKKKAEEAQMIDDAPLQDMPEDL